MATQTYNSFKSENCCSKYCISSRQSLFLLSDSSSSSIIQISAHRKQQAPEVTIDLQDDESPSELEDSSSPFTLFVSLPLLVTTGMAAAVTELENEAWTRSSKSQTVEMRREIPFSV